MGDTACECERSQAANLAQSLHLLNSTEVHDKVSAAFKQALIAWVAAGHKLLIQDSDSCAGNRTPKYEFLPYKFATVNPGASGSPGLAGILENSTLVSARKRDASFIDPEAWKNGPNDLGDSNIVVQNDPRWCGAMWAKNKLHKSGLALAYAHYGRGLIVLCCTRIVRPFAVWMIDVFTSPQT